MDAEKQAMIDKILKLLELGKEDNGAYTHEQRAANDMAAKLMAKHAIDFGDLKSSRPKNHTFENIRIDPLDESYCMWEDCLANGIAMAFDCTLVCDRYPTFRLNFLGTKNDLEIVIFFYRHLVRTIGRKSEIEYKNIKDQETYALGMVAIISSRLEALYQRRQEVMESDCRSLIVVKKDQLEEFKKQQYPKLITPKETKIKGSWEAWERGIAAGNKVNLNRPVGHSGESTKSIK